MCVSAPSLHREHSDSVVVPLGSKLMQVMRFSSRLLSAELLSRRAQFDWLQAELQPDR